MEYWQHIPGNTISLVGLLIMVWGIAAFVTLCIVRYRIKSKSHPFPVEINNETRIHAD
jgi:heme/copper-type cytochrome/quinol oxidase subunit 2